ncbi:MAG: hypothetical protein P4L71_03340 [Acetobacteraceae bacterium]|nr:hypothetical protein [Acetobacteraceae bacterium]
MSPAPAITVAVINASTVVTDAACASLTAALQKQVSNDFAPVWGIDATLVFVPKGGTPPAGTWWLSILDNTDRALVLGHHELTPDGFPVGKVFAGTDKRFGLKWTVTASHELLEMLADPGVNLTVFVHPTEGSGTLYAYEICDPCQDESFAYEIDGIPVCDFVHPTYFETFRAPGSTQFDHMGKLPAPIPGVLQGGYVTSYDVHGTQDWQPVKAASVPYGPADRTHLPDRPSHRQARRRMPQAAWRRSSVTP